MPETKRVTIMRAGGTASAEAELIPGQTVEQLIRLVAPELGWPPEGSYQLVGPDGTQITGDVYKAVKSGDKLTLAQIGVGG